MCSKRTYRFPETNAKTKISSVLDTNGEVVIIDYDEELSPFPTTKCSHTSKAFSSYDREEIGNSRPMDHKAVSRPKRLKMEAPFKTDLTTSFPKDRVGLKILIAHLNSKRRRFCL